jgi:uncharacterized membrane protein
MKDSSLIAIIVAMFAVVAFRIYKKYFSKDKAPDKKSGTGGSAFASSRKEDDYEPYSKK